MKETCTLTQETELDALDYDGLWKQMESLLEEQDDEEEDEITGMIDVSHLPVSSEDASQEDDEEDEITGMIKID